MAFLFRRRAASVEPAPLGVPRRDDPAERRRQRAVDATGLVGSRYEERFNRIVEMARSLYHTDAAAFSIVDHDREWMKAAAGTSVAEIDRDRSFCSVTIQQDGPLFVGDATQDPLFSGYPGVVGEPGVRFYYGVPIVSHDGEKIGALCVIDTSPRERETVDEWMLLQLAHLIQMELRLTPSYQQSRQQPRQQGELA